MSLLQWIFIFRISLSTVWVTISNVGFILQIQMQV